MNKEIKTDIYIDEGTMDKEKKTNIYIDEDTIEETNKAILEGLYIPKTHEELEALLNDESK